MRGLVGCKRLYSRGGRSHLPNFPQVPLRIELDRVLLGRSKHFTRTATIYLLAGTVTLHWLMIFMLIASIGTVGDYISGLESFKSPWSANSRSEYSKLTGVRF